MLRLMISLLIAVTLLLCGVQGAAVAHTHLDEAGHSVQGLDEGHHEVGSPMIDDQTDREKGRDTAQHHHCSAGLADDATIFCDRVEPVRSQPVAALEVAMTSRATAPPTEPPSI